MLWLILLLAGGVAAAAAASGLKLPGSGASSPPPALPAPAPAKQKGKLAKDGGFIHDTAIEVLDAYDDAKQWANEHADELLALL